MPQQQTFFIVTFLETWALIFLLRITEMEIPKLEQFIVARDFPVFAF